MEAPDYLAAQQRQLRRRLRATGRWLSTHLAAVWFAASASALVFCVGAYCATHHLFPYSLLERAVGEYRALTQGVRPHNLTPAWYPYSGARMHDASRVAPGVTLITSAWRGADGWKPRVRLIDQQGHVLHEWDAAPERLWPESPYRDHLGDTKNRSDNYVHGTHLFDNGDLILNIEYLTVARLDSRGEVLWKLPIRAHHSVEADVDGNFWVCSIRWIEDTAADRQRLAEYPGLRAPVVEDWAVKVSPQGRVLKEVNITRALYRSGYQSLLWSSGGRTTDDILHVNDVQPVPPQLVEQYPGFSPGDLLVSARTIHTVLLIDPEREEIKWTASGFVKQHDVDLVAGGRVRVFDNRNDGTETGEFLGPTRLVTLTVADPTLRVIYPRAAGQSFYTQWGGKVQDLANGNLLLTEARRGRVFEIDGSGHTVWEWVQDKTDEGMVPEVLEGSRYELSLETIAAWKKR